MTVRVPPPARARAAVRALADEQIAAVERLGTATTRAMAPVLAQAERELTEQLRHWVATHPGGDARFTPYSYQAALHQIASIREALARRFGQVLGEHVPGAQHLALDHLTDEVARLSALFGQPQAIHLDVARQIATGESYLIPRVRTSAARYARNVGEDIHQRLAVDVLKGAPLSETIDRLVAQGGPRGLVALRGVAGETGALVEAIPEGLFVRYRSWAERVARTEIQSGYNAQLLEGLHEARHQLPDLQKRWSADASACDRICRPIDGQVQPLDSDFDTPRGPIDFAPAHPNCRCRSGAWRAAWGEDLRAD